LDNLLDANTIKLTHFWGYDLFLSDFLLDFKFAFYTFFCWVRSGTRLKALYSPHKKKRLLYIYFPNIKWVAMQDGLTVREQNLLLSVDCPPNDFDDTGSGVALRHFGDSYVKSSYIVIQPSSGDSVNCVKNWSPYKWRLLILELVKIYPDLNIIALGGADELSVELFLPINECKNLKSLIGKTTISEAASLIANAKLYLGLDSGLMHIAANMGVPTVSIWGPSSFYDYGYEDGYLGVPHLCIASNSPCSPCLSPFKANISRVSSPAMCPDKVCLAELTVEAVGSQIIKFFDRVNI
jgi:ADP-heptose:LPS heptosyltransferase